MEVMGGAEHAGGFCASQQPGWMRPSSVGLSAGTLTGSGGWLVGWSHLARSVLHPARGAVQVVPPALLQQ